MAWLHAVIDVPAGASDAESTFWSGALGWPVGAPWPGHPELRSFTPPDGDAYLHVQVVEALASQWGSRLHPTTKTVWSSHDIPTE
jgi:hypothetical protein